jgi:hypothetical protein
MAIKPWCVAVAVTALALSASVSVRAENLTVHPTNTRTPLIGADDVGGAGSAQTDRAQEDDASTVTDLEATRAALDRRAGPVVSLSVSGWVAEQVIRTH